MSLYTGSNVFEWFNLINENKDQIEPQSATTSATISTGPSQNEEEPKKKSITEIAMYLRKQRDEINSLQLK